LLLSLCRNMSRRWCFPNFHLDPKTSRGAFRWRHRSSSRRGCRGWRAAYAAHRGPLRGPRVVSFGTPGPLVMEWPSLIYIYIRETYVYIYIYTYNYIDIDIDLDSWIYNLDISIFGIPKLDISQRFAAFNGGRWPWYGTGWRTGSPRCRAWAGCARPASWAERLKPIDSWDVVDDPQNEDIMCDIYIYGNDVDICIISTV
jgi:hypothetical protein